MRPAPASSRSSSKASTPSTTAKKRIPIDFSYDVDSEGYDEQDLDSESEELEMSEEMKQQLEQGKAGSLFAPSANGLYATLNREGKYELDDPQQMFDIHYFKEHPEVFYSFASQIYPSNFIPSPCHRFIKLLEDRSVLLRNYTQNIDTLESKLGVQKVLRCHGSFATASCLQCRRKVPGAEIEQAIFAKEIPICTVCKAAPPPPPQIKRRKSGGKKKGKRPWDGDSSGDDLPTTTPPKPTAIMKAVTDDFDKCLLEDRGKADLLLVIGTSLKVAPVSELLTHLPHSILINKTPVPHVNPDIVLLGDADAVVKYLCSRLRWKLPGLPTNNEGLPPEPERVADSHVWLFEGAEGGAWVEKLRQGSVESDKEAIASATAIGLSPNVGKVDNSSGGGSGKITPVEAEGDARQTKKARLG
ncbi:NAD-dependent histone deacetylase sir2 [Tulasnella sp. UAMH 9824]|nr:NAD-dependent histone deacetylase sir2 [Tulasnella sp. UAMH 9824]